MTQKTLNTKIEIVLLGIKIDMIFRKTNKVFETGCPKSVLIFLSTKYNFVVFILSTLMLLFWEEITAKPS
jgi:hypothetical protein